MSSTPPPDFFDDALRRLDSNSPTVSPPPQDGFLFSGNRYETVPRALFFDRRLTPLERNAWQVIRFKLNDDGVTAFPTYEELRPLLSLMPCAPKASHETVARAISLLRLTRWLSLVRRRRDRKTGRIQGNLYVLHDEPLTPFEAIQLDPEYLSLLSRALDHAGKSVRLVGSQVLRELGEDPLLARKLLPSRLQILMQRMAGGELVQETCPQTKTSRETYPQEEVIHDSEEGKNESEAGGKPKPEVLLRNPKQDSTSTSTVLIDNSKEVRTVLRARESQEGEDGLRWPRRFRGLKEEQQAGARVALGQLDSGQQQAVLDEWDVRCCEGNIRHPAAYLFGIIQKALRGEFKVWAGQEAGQAPSETPKPSPEADKAGAVPPVSSEVAREHLVHLRAILRGAPCFPGAP